MEAEAVVMDYNIVISTQTIFITLMIALGIWFLVQIKAIVLVLFISLILAMGLAPLVDRLVRRGLGRGLAVALIMFLVGGLGLLILALGFSPMVEQTRVFLQRFPDFINNLTVILGLGHYMDRVNEVIFRRFTDASPGMIRATWGAFSSVLTLVMIFVLTAYLLLDLENLRERFLTLFTRGTRKKVEEVVNEIETKIGSWLRGQLILCLVVGAMSFVGLSLLGVDYALPLALIAGLLEIVPIIGPIISAVPAAVVGLVASPIMGLGVIALYILIQQLENNLIVPKVMQKTVGLNPLVTLVAILIAGKLFGLGGVLLAVPVTLIGVTVFKVLAYSDTQRTADSRRG